MDRASAPTVTGSARARRTMFAWIDRLTAAAAAEQLPAAHTASYSSTLDVCRAIAALDHPLTNTHAHI
jgi:hypothetical protein